MACNLQSRRARMGDMKTKLLTLMLFSGVSLFAETHFSIGIGIGAHYFAPPPPPMVVYRPPCPDPDYTWISGYWYPVGPRYVWHAGYWALPPYVGAYWVAPRYYSHRYYPGYWKGRGRHWKDHDDNDQGEHYGHRWYHGDDDDR